MKHLNKSSTGLMMSSLLMALYYPVNSVQALDVIDPIRVMAAQCAQCHGMEGNMAEGFESLNGESFNEIYEELLEMQNSTENELMHRQAKGYTDQQIWALAEYFSEQPRSGNSDSNEKAKGKNEENSKH
ncbi:MAG: c-type cytochrome [Gammaproteobacteria bacterium]